MRLHAALLAVALLAAAPVVARATDPPSAVRPPRIAVVSLHLAEFPNLARAAAARVAPRMKVDLYGIGGGLLPSIKDVDLGAYDLVVIEGVGPRLLDFKDQVERTKARTRVLVIEQTAWVQGNIDAGPLPELSDFWANATTENYARLFDDLGVKLLHLPGTAQPPVVYAATAYHHPDAAAPFPTLDAYLAWQRRRLPDADQRPRVGVSFFRSLVLADNAGVPDALIREIERQGGLPIPAWRKDSSSAAFDAPFTVGGKPFVDSVVLCASQINYTNSAAGVAAAKRLNTPILSCDTDWYSTPAEWEASLGGFSPRRSGELTLGEGDGVVEPITVGARAVASDGSATNTAIDHQVAWRVRRAMAWARLKRLPNAEKRLVVPFYSESSSRGDVGADTDTYMDAQGSLAALLKRLKAEGYDVGAQPLPDRAELTRRMVEASNAAVWTAAGLEEGVAANRVVLVPEAEYRAWWNTLPEAARRMQEAQWGPPPGGLMIHTDPQGRRSIAIPVLRFGKVVLAPHPTWGYLQDPRALVEKAALAPHHQYAAFYYWMRRGWRADAYVSLFSQLSLMPGKQEGPSSEDWVSLLIGDVPHISPVALQANGGVGGKRRTQATTIGFMPALVKSGLAPELADLRARLARRAALPDGAVRETLEDGVRRDLAAEGLGRDLALDPKTAPWPLLETALNRYLTEVDRAAMPAGAHVLGEAPSADTSARMVEAMISGDGAADPTTLEQVRAVMAGDAAGVAPAAAAKIADYAARVASAPGELDALVNALNGGYVEPGPMEDAVRNPDALPAGRNPFFLDVRSMPTKEAWTVGVRLADDMLGQYRAKHARYPRRTAFVLWSSETTQSQGVLEAEILHLVGAHPVWNPKGQVTDVALDSAVALGRPRVDVLVTTSGTYRDHFRSKLDLLAKAIALAAAAPEADNALRANTAALAARLRKEGASPPDAQARAGRRIFSDAPGAYSPNTQFAMDIGGAAATDKALTALYTGRLGYAWGGADEGAADEGAFKGALGSVEASMFSRAANTYGLLDDSMPAAYLGGLAQAARSEGSASVESYITNLQSPKDAKVETLQRFYARELRSRYFNPAWIRAMQGSGFAGARYMSELGKNLLFWDVVEPDLVTDKDWSEVRDVYLRDRYKLGLADWFKTQNPEARRTLAHAMLDAVRRGRWKADTATVAELNRADGGRGLPAAAPCGGGCVRARSTPGGRSASDRRAGVPPSMAPNPTKFSGFEMAPISLAAAAAPSSSPRSLPFLLVLAGAFGLLLLGAQRRPRW